MSDRIIQAADLSRIASALGSLGEGVDRVSAQVDAVDTAVTVTRVELADLQQQFHAFELRYERATEVGLAETRLVKIRQELERDFGHHGDVRRTATGILQASDIGIVRQDTINGVTEELMLLAPGYWLAPALVALSAWIQDRQDLAQRALAEALRRDDEKTSLFFALVCRRAGRNVACGTWLDRYLGQQNPFELKRQTIVLIDATAGGVFASDVQMRCRQRFNGWIEELASRAGFVETQRQQWRDALEFRIGSSSHASSYPQLSQHSPTWPALNDSLNRSLLNADVLAYLKGIYEAPLPSATRLIDAVDAQLERLVADHDEPELPLRREEALLQLIIQEGGSRADAQKKFALEQGALEEEVSFTQLLTNAAMHAEKSGATLASQRLALALSRDWLRDAYSDVTLATRQAVPGIVDLAIDGWSGTTADGHDEDTLVADLERHLSLLEEEAMAQVKMQPKHWIVGAIGALMVYAGLSGGWLLAGIGLLMIGWVFLEYRGLDKRRASIRDAFEQRRTAQTAILCGCIAELVEWRRDFASKDGGFDETAAYFGAISSDSHLAAPQDGVRRILDVA